MTKKEKRFGWWALDEERNPYYLGDFSDLRKDPERLAEFERSRDIMWRRVGEATVGPFWVSTVFLGLDHSFGEGPPELFETMIFLDGEDQYCERYATWAGAEQGHERAVKQTRGAWGWKRRFWRWWMGVQRRFEGYWFNSPRGDGGPLA